jgi:hypothetical protein
MLRAPANAELGPANGHASGFLFQVVVVRERARRRVRSAGVLVRCAALHPASGTSYAAARLPFVARPGSGRLPSGCRPSGSSLRAGGLRCSLGSVACRTPRSGARSLTRERRARDCASGLLLQHLRHRTRHARPAARRAPALTGGIGVSRTLTRAGLGLAAPRRRQAYAGTPGLGKADGNGLLGRARTVCAAADLANLLVHELAGLRRRRLSRALRFAGLLDGSLLRHVTSSNGQRDPRCARSRESLAHIQENSQVRSLIRSIAGSRMGDPKGDQSRCIALTPTALRALAPFAARQVGPRGPGSRAAASTVTLAEAFTALPLASRLPAPVRRRLGQILQRCILPGSAAL